MSVLAPVGSLSNLFPPLQDPFNHELADAGRTASFLRPLTAIQPAFVLPRLDEGGAARGILNPTEQAQPSIKAQDGRYGSAEPGPRETQGEESQKVEAIAQLCTGLVDSLDELDIWTAAAQFPPSGHNATSENRQKEFMTWSQSQLPDATSAGSLSQEPSPYLSEAGLNVFDSFLQTVDETTLRDYATQQTASSADTIDLLMRATLGRTETQTLKWDVESQAFIWLDRVSGLDASQSRSLTTTFLQVATCLRRLEILVDEGHAVAQTSTHHALYHALSTYLSYIRHRLERARASIAAPNIISATRTIRDAQVVLSALCELMGWPLSDAEPTTLSSQPVKILNILHSHLAAHLPVPASLATPVQLATAYLLEKSSRPWLDTLHQWVGLKRVSNETESSDQPWDIIGVEQTKSAVGHWEYTFHPRRMPTFVPKDDGRRIFEAGRSLRLLARATEGRHPFVGRSWYGIEGVWPWTNDVSRSIGPEDHLKTVQRSLRKARKDDDYSEWAVDNEAVPSSASAASAAATDPFYARSGLQDLSKPLEENPLWRMFDALPTVPGQREEPSTDAVIAVATSSVWQSSSSFDSLVKFLDDRAGRPLLGHGAPSLAASIQTDLLAIPIAHGSLASSALLAYFLQELHFLDHLAILRAFFLGGDIGFTDRVRAALFGDGEVDGQAVGVGRRARTRMRLGLGGEQDQAGVSDETWGVGLAIGLSDRQCWPPGGAELSYALRTTLVDMEKKSTSVGAAGVCPEVWKEVDERLSFAVKELNDTNGNGKARWTDPQAIEALDFLYLSYEPPSVMSVLITPDIVIKYQTVFSFLLRLSRVDTVARSLYNDIFHLVPSEEEPIKLGVDTAQTSRRSRTPFTAATRAKHTIFRAHPAALSTLHRLRFRISHFIAAISQYTLDCAISRNWDMFLRRMEKIKIGIHRASYGPEAGEDDGFGIDDDPDEGVLGGEIGDIQVLVLYHHHVLDRILRGCLLGPGAGQQAMNRILMGLFGCVLDVGKLVKGVTMRRMGEDEGADRLLKLKVAWEEREGMLLHGLEKLSMRGALAGGSRGIGDDDMASLLRGEDVQEGAKAVDGGLGELLLRLQLGKPRQST